MSFGRGDATGAIGLHHREPLWNVHRKRFEMPLLFGHAAPRGGLEPSVKAVSRRPRFRQSDTCAHARWFWVEKLGRPSP